MLPLLLLHCLGIATATPSVSFSIPALVGSSNSSAANGSAFWFPGISIPTGIPGHVAQHITLSGDGGGGCEHEGQRDQACEQIMLTTDGGRSYTVTKKIRLGTSVRHDERPASSTRVPSHDGSIPWIPIALRTRHTTPPAHSPHTCLAHPLRPSASLTRLAHPLQGNFDGYGDLGTRVPPHTDTAAPPPGEFKAIVGCNDCFAHPGGSLSQPAFLQTWLDNGTSLLQTQNQSITYTNTPAALTAPGFGFSAPDQSIVRTPSGDLLMALYGHAKDGYKNGTKYTTVFYTSSDDGLMWS